MTDKRAAIQDILKRNLYPMGTDPVTDDSIFEAEAEIARKYGMRFFDEGDDAQDVKIYYAPLVDTILVDLADDPEIYLFRIEIVGIAVKPYESVTDGPPGFEKWTPARHALGVKLLCAKDRAGFNEALTSGSAQSMRELVEEYERDQEREA